jgi:Cu-processing system permease protein
MSSAVAASARRVLAVAGMTFREAFRRKILVAAFAMTAAFLVLYGVGVHLLGQELAMQDIMGTGPVGSLVDSFARAQMLYMGLFPASFILGLTAVFASVGCISSELDSGVMHGVLSRPIARWELVLGKASGLAAMLAVYSTVLVGSVIGLAKWQVDAPLSDVWGALGLFVLEPMVLLALAVLGSSRLPTIANGVLCTALYGMGFVGGFIEQIGSLMKSRTMLDLGIVSSLIVPADAVHRKAVSLLMPGGLLLGDFSGGQGGGFGSSAVPSAWMILYALVYIAFLLWLAMRVFKRRDL